MYSGLELDCPIQIPAAKQAPVRPPRKSAKEKKKVIITANARPSQEQSQLLSLQERLKKNSTVVSFPTIDFRVVKHRVPKSRRKV